MTKPTKRKPDPLVDWKRIDALSDDEIRHAIDGDAEAVPELTASDIADMERVYPPAAIAALRERLGLSQAAFAALIGVHPTTVGRWERGAIRPSQPVHNLLRLIDNDPHAVQHMRRAA